MNVVLLLASIQAFFLFSLLLAKPRKSPADKVLMTWLAGIGLHTLVYFLHYQLRWSVPLVINLNSAFPFLQGPFLLAYVAALVGMRQRFSGLDLLHLLPFFGFLTYMAISRGAGSFSPSPHQAVVSVDIFSASGAFGVLLLLSVPAYSGWSLLLMRRARRALPDTTPSNRFRWVWGVIAGLGLVWIVTLAAALLKWAQLPHPHMIFWALTVVVYVLGYLGLIRTSVFSPPEMETLKKELRPKYAKSGLRTDDARALYEALVEYVDGEQVFLDPDVSLSDLSRHLGRSSNHVSQVINEFDQCNFRDFINSRRVSEACLRLREARDSNLLELAMDVGFNSKSSFNRAFRKFTESTPSEYLSRI